MKKAVLCIWLVLGMGLISPAAVKAEAPYRYRSIPFEATTANEIEPILAKEFAQISALARVASFALLKRQATNNTVSYC